MPTNKELHAAKMKRVSPLKEFKEINLIITYNHFGEIGF